MLRRSLAVGGLCGALLAAPAHPQTVDGLAVSALVGRWKLVYIESGTCSYGNIAVSPANLDGRADATVDVSCAGVDSVYKFSVASTGHSSFVFYGVSTSGPNGIGPNHLKYELIFNKLDCTLTGRWFVDNPIGRLALRKEGDC
jgi:hypothetical protein